MEHQNKNTELAGRIENTFRVENKVPKAPRRLLNYIAGLDIVEYIRRTNCPDNNPKLSDAIQYGLSLFSMMFFRYMPLPLEMIAVCDIVNGEYMRGLTSLATAEAMRFAGYQPTKKMIEKWNIQKKDILDLEVFP